MRKTLAPALIGGGIGGLLDILYACIVWGVFRPPHDAMVVLQSVASGLLGKDSYSGGTQTAVLGLALHFFIAFVMALVYVVASKRITALTARPVLMGMLYGVVLFAVMNFVVVPLSAIGWRTPTLVGLTWALIPHVIFVGPAIALAAARTDSRPRP